MAAVKGVPSILAGYFNVAGDTGSLGGTVTLPSGEVIETEAGVSAKRDLKSFTAEVKALPDKDKEELVRWVCEVTGDPLPAVYANQTSTASAE